MGRAVRRANRRDRQQIGACHGMDEASKSQPALLVGVGRWMGRQLRRERVGVVPMNARVSLVKSTCGHEIRPDGLAAGYARAHDGRVLCYTCADTEQLVTAQHAQRGDIISAYVSSDGQSITTWSGGMIGRVIRRSEGWVSPSARGVYITAKIPGGPWVYGRGGGNGMCITLRPYARQEWRA